METCGSEKKQNESVIMPWAPNFSDARLQLYMAKQPTARIPWQAWVNFSPHAFITDNSLILVNL